MGRNAAIARSDPIYASGRFSRFVGIPRHTKTKNARALDYLALGAKASSQILNQLFAANSLVFFAVLGDPEKSLHVFEIERGFEP